MIKPVETITVILLKITVIIAIIKMLSKKNQGYSLIMWTVTFAVLLAALAIIQMPLKRALYSKTKQTADYVLWTSWGNATILEPPEQNTRTKTTSQHQQRSYILESHSGNINASAESSGNQSIVSSSVEEGSEVLLNTFGL